MPVRHVAISASHEIYSSMTAAVKAMVEVRIANLDQRERQARQSGRRRRLVETTPMLRSIDGGVDDQKFLYPVPDNLPLIVFPLLSYALAGVEVSVYGSPEIGRVVDVVRARLVRDGRIRDSEAIRFVEEDRGQISMSRSLRKAASRLTAPPGAMILWSAGDLVLAYNTYRRLADPHARDHEIVIDLNARQVVFPAGSPELFPRNYLDGMRLEGAEHRVVDVKEPNALLFTAAGLSGLDRLDELRHPPPGDTHLDALVRLAVTAVRGASLRATAALVWYGLKRRWGALGDRDGILQRHAVDLASAAFGVPTMVKADNVDPFFMRDCDGFEDLFGYYRTLLQSIVDSASTREAGYRELARYYPYADVLYRLSYDFRPLQDEIPLWRHWPDIVRDKIAAFNQRFEAELDRRGPHGPPQLIPEYFDDARGAFRGIPAPSDDLRATRELLLGGYGAAFERDRERYCRLAADR